MRTTLLFALIALAEVSAWAQSTDDGPVKSTEIGITTPGLLSFGLTFRVGNERAVWRFNNLRLNGLNNTQKLDSMTIKRPEQSCQLALGREWRKPIKDRAALRAGVDLGYALLRQVYDLDDISHLNNDYLQITTTHTPSVNLVAGFHVRIGNRFLLGAEVLPVFNYVIVRQKTTSPGFTQTSMNTSYNFGMNIANALLSFVYRIR